MRTVQPTLTAEDDQEPARRFQNDFTHTEVLWNSWEGWMKSLIYVDAIETNMLWNSHSEYIMTVQWSSGRQDKLKSRSYMATDMGQ
jgi:hypothetical protein